MRFIDQDYIQLNDEQDENFKPRRRLRKEKSRKSSIQHRKVQKGQEHYSRNGKQIPGKTFQSQSFCSCKMRCYTKIDGEQQHALFQAFYNFPDWTRKSLFLRSSVERKQVIQNLSELNPIIPQKERKFVYSYRLLDSDGNRQEVCQSFFLNCLQVNSSRVYRTIKTIISNPTAEDHRGNQPSINKTNWRDKKYAKEFIAKFPKYKSHYGRTDSDRDYLAPYLNLRKIYREYQTITQFRQRPVLSEHIFREIFNTEFNLAFKRPKTDTCKTCDEIRTKIKSAGLSSEQLQAQESLQLNHYQNVRRKKLEFEKDISDAKSSNGKIQCYTFDLQKTLETPSLTTNEAYYRRQLWTLNLCIYDEVAGKGFMYIWSENIASRGADEIGSCLIKHVRNFLPHDAEKIILYSDSCGGQNRNIKMTMLLKKLLTSLVNVTTIIQKFFISGHSYNSCDRCFGIIDKQRRVTQDIFLPKHWKNVIRIAKKRDPKFEVVEMSRNDFYWSDKLLKLIVNRKISDANVKFNWHHIQSIKNIKDQPFVMYITQSQPDDELKVNLHKKDVIQSMFIDLELENSPEKKISKEKYDDLIKLLKYIPMEFHEFYKNLQHSGDTVGDYSLADSSDEE